MGQASGVALLEILGAPASPGQYRPPLLMLLFTADVPVPLPHFKAQHL